MKKHIGTLSNIITSFLLVLITSTGYSQNLYFEIRGTYQRPVHKEKLQQAETLQDMVIGYPSNWIGTKDYISTEITVTRNGSVNQATSANETLSEEQRDLLATADLGSDVILDVTYRYKNAAIDQTDVRNMHVSQTVVPEIEAEYASGQDQMKVYIQQTAIDKISEADSKLIKQALVKFTINEKGEITNATLTTSSGIEKVDKVLLKAIKKMPKWKPAENSSGIKVSQDFQFSVGMGGC